MLNALEAIIQPNGYIGFSDPDAPVFDKPAHVYVLFTKPVALPARDEALSGAHLSEKALGADWLNPAEDDAWAHLQ